MLCSQLHRMGRSSHVSMAYRIIVRMPTPVHTVLTTHVPTVLAFFIHGLQQLQTNNTSLRSVCCSRYDSSERTLHKLFNEVTLQRLQCLLSLPVYSYIEQRGGFWYQATRMVLWTLKCSLAGSALQSFAWQLC